MVELAPPPPPTVRVRRRRGGQACRDDHRERQPRDRPKTPVLVHYSIVVAAGLVVAV